VLSRQRFTALCRLTAVMALVAFGGASLPVAAQEPVVPPCGSFPADQDQITCSCGTNPSRAGVWGSNPYTADSDICTAAIHAGAITIAGGAVTVVRVPGLESYPASARNGVETFPWGPYPNAFTFAGEMDRADHTPQLCLRLPVGTALLVCLCPPAEKQAGDAVWGSGPYTADSDICSAATHAGAIGPVGGQVTVLWLMGLSRYASSERNGVLTGEWGGFESSFTFDFNR